MSISGVVYNMAEVMCTCYDVSLLKVTETNEFNKSIKCVFPIIVIVINEDYFDDLFLFFYMYALSGVQQNRRFKVS
jgi:hypothetical protein